MVNKRIKKLKFVTADGKYITLINPADLVNDESGYMRKIIGNILVTEMTERQARVWCLHYFKDLYDAEIADLLGVNRSTVSRTLARANRHIAESIGRFKADCVHIIDATDEPKVVGHISRVYKVQNAKPNEEDKNKKKRYEEMSEQYEETIAFIERRISQLSEQLRSPSLNYLERQPLYRRKAELEKELEELRRSSVCVRKYVD